MAAPIIGSLAGLEKGQLTLKDFEWEPDLRPSSLAAAAGSSISIPEIDLQALYTQYPLDRPRAASTDYAALVASLSQAASSIGFFHVYNHGISLSALEDLQAYARRFFVLPFTHKIEATEFLHHPSLYSSGSPFNSPNKWWVEGIRLSSSADKQVILSLAKCLCTEEQEQQAFCKIVEECVTGFAKLAKDLTSALLEGLALKGDEIVEKYVGGEVSHLQLNHYPPCPQPDMTLGLPPHSDVSILTLLWQDLVGGLQVCINGEWITVKPRRDCLVVNIGDVFQIWSNDHYLSGLHRATLNARESRYSIGFFFYLGMDSMLAPIQELLEEKKESSKFQSTIMSEHRSYIYSKVFERGSEGVRYLKC